MRDVLKAISVELNRQRDLLAKAPAADRRRILGDVDRLIKAKGALLNGKEESECTTKRQ